MHNELNKVWCEKGFGCVLKVQGLSREVATVCNPRLNFPAQRLRFVLLLSEFRINVHEFCHDEAGNGRETHPDEKLLVSQLFL